MGRNGSISRGAVTDIRRQVVVHFNSLSRVLTTSIRASPRSTEPEGIEPAAAGNVKMQPDVSPCDLGQSWTTYTHTHARRNLRTHAHILANTVEEPYATTHT